MTKFKRVILEKIGKFLNRSKFRHLRNRFYLWVCRRRHLASTEREWFVFDELKAVMDLER